MSDANIVGVDLRDPIYTAGDVTRLAGLSYRQINDWDARVGVMNSGRDSAEGWRKFNLLEVFALCVCAKLREELLVPLDKVGNLYRWMINPVERKSTEREIAFGIPLVKEAFKKRFPNLPVPDDDFFKRSFMETDRKSPIQLAVELMDEGEPYCLSTDFTKSFIFNDGILKQMLCSKIAKNPTVIFLLNPVLDKALKDLDLKPTAFRHLFPAEVMAKLKAAAEEQEIVGLIQNYNFHTVTLHTKNGRVVRAECTENTPKTDDKKRVKQILEALEGGDFSTVTVHTAGGKILGLERKTIIKFGK